MTSQLGISYKSLLHIALLIVAISRTSAPQTIQQDHAIRLHIATHHGRRPPHQTYIRWLHIPKTGTSFANTLVRWGCTNLAADIIVRPRKEVPANLTLPGANLSWDWLFRNKSGRVFLDQFCTPRLTTRRAGVQHYSFMMHAAMERWERPCAVAMFRLPLQRMYSNYEHLTFHYNASRRAGRSLREFLERREFWSQQTKMLLGRDYRAVDMVSRAEAYAAARIVERDMAFVGLTEFFNLSVRLFHAKFGGVPHRSQFWNVRPGISRFGRDVSSAFRYDEEVFRGWKDVPDEIVYEAVRKRFWKEVCFMRSAIQLDGLGDVEMEASKGCAM